MLFEKKKREISLHISGRKCIGCEECVSRCRHRVIGITYKDDRGFATVEFIDRCVGCGKCVKVCKMNAIELIK